MPQSLTFAVIMLLAGFGVPILAAMNAALGARLGNPAAAAACFFIVAFLLAVTVALVTSPAALKAIPSQPKYLFLGGLLIGFYLLSISYIAPHFGVGNAVFFVLLGQLAAAAAIDHFGLFGAREAALTPIRAGGIALMAAGVLLTQKA